VAGGYFMNVVKEKEKELFLFFFLNKEVIE
jgi:hypothetical protein